MSWLAFLGAALLLGLLLVCPLAILESTSKGFLRWPNGKRRRHLQPASAQRAVPAATVLRQHEGPCQLPTLLRLLREQWQQLGLGPRALLDGLPQAMLTLTPQLAVLQAVGPGVYACQKAQLVCGFDVDRTEAEAALAPHRPGTFCLRLSSMPGHLVVSLREPPDALRRRRSTDASACNQGSGSYGPSSESDDQPAVSHYLFRAERLHLTGLSRALAEVPGCIRLLDLSNGRTHRPSILRKAAAAAAAELHAAPNAATAWPIAP
ncbi:hypothetical protein COHA_004772 [Chlorella ohadii]|uniref:SH2 domain-containing protein n=1 Tax=Chlorella ohadii TaxID=2649997 RepID=A0AAD5DPY7_9CHLO|nr:hypothetical protein COHA_004772 [Chlorella ohadii]